MNNLSIDAIIITRVFKMNISSESLQLAEAITRKMIKLNT